MGYEDNLATMLDEARSIVAEQELAKMKFEVASLGQTVQLEDA